MGKVGRSKIKLNYELIKKNLSGVPGVYKKRK
ncbi:hypothetical protein ES703_55367 [subsurface metagenome]